MTLHLITWSLYIWPHQVGFLDSFATAVCDVVGTSPLHFCVIFCPMVQASVHVSSFSHISMCLALNRYSSCWSWFSPFVIFFYFFYFCVFFLLGCARGPLPCCVSISPLYHPLCYYAIMLSYHGFGVGFM